MSSPPTRPVAPLRVWDDPRIVAPDEATWARMSPIERDAAEETILGALDEHREAMSEGTRHFRAKTGAAADLDGHFRRAGRDVFIACELAVLYPGEAAIVPDLLAVLDCDPDLDLDSWRVADQKRGIDLILEVRNQGKKHKDLVDNVADYARLRVPEYFSFDVRSQVLRGWRLPTARSRVYQPVLPQGGYLSSNVLNHVQLGKRSFRGRSAAPGGVRAARGTFSTASRPVLARLASRCENTTSRARRGLGVEVAVVERRLRFFSSGAMVPTTGELLARLQEMADRSQQVAAESQQAAALNEHAAAESQRVAAEATDRAARALAGLAASILRVCDRGGVALDDRQRARVIAEGDVDRLTRWLDRALVAETADALFDDA